ncbi:hypothetical protein Bca4012_064889 [Brassica carinata]
MEIGLGIPRMYLCGALTVLLTSKTKENPGRRFYRCRVVFGDKHVFKWADDAYLEELELIAEKQSSMEKEVMEIKEHLLEIKKDITEIVEVVTALSTKIRNHLFHHLHPPNHPIQFRLSPKVPLLSAS